jgi:ribosomal protein S18
VKKTKRVQQKIDFKNSASLDRTVTQKTKVETVQNLGLGHL